LQLYMGTRKASSHPTLLQDSAKPISRNLDKALLLCDYD
jgi:hypothetical protein